MIKIENLNYKNLIKNLNFKADKWLFIITWPSWTGKTTLFKIISNIIPSENKIIIPQKIWVFWQENNLLPLDGETNINLPFYLKKFKKDKKWEKNLINYFWAENLINKNIDNLSSGEKEKIWLIKAFIHKPKLVLLDEAGNCLDEKNRNKLENFLINYSKENVILWITHKEDIKNLLWKEIYNYNFKIYASKINI